MVELSTEAMYEGITSTNELGTLPGTRLYGRYTGKYQRALRSSSGSKKKFSGWFTVSVPKRRAHHRRFDCRVLFDVTELETWTRAQTHFCRGHDSAIWWNLIWRWLSKSAKFKSPPNFPAIR